MDESLQIVKWYSNQEVYNLCGIYFHERDEVLQKTGELLTLEVGYQITDLKKIKFQRLSEQYKFLSNSKFQWIEWND